MSTRDRSIDDEEGVAPIEDRSRGGVLLGLAVIVLLGLLAFAVYFKMQPATDRLINTAEEEFKVSSTRAPPGPRERVPPPVAETPPADNSELAQYLLRLQAQRELAEQQARARAEEQALKVAQEQAERRRKRVSAPIMVISQGGETAPEPERTGEPLDAFARQLGDALGTSGGSTQPESRAYDFLPSASAADVPVVLASQIHGLGLRLNQGKVISAVLESRIVSDKPGVVRAMVDEDVYSEDGTNVLVRPGARLIGEYRSAVVRGDSRLLVIWNRLIRPDGASVNLTSPGVDELGVSGLTGHVDSRFFERFGAAILLSVVDIAASEQTNENAVVVAGDVESSASIALRESINLPPRITVDQGSRISVMVAKDLDFRQVGPAVASR